MSRHPIEYPASPAMMRLAALASLDDPARAALALAAQRPRHFRIRRDIQTEGQEITDSLLILSGWAARVRILEDGRRQILNFLLPGDLIGMCYHERPTASSTVVAFTEVEVCSAPDADAGSPLALAYAVSRALDEAYLFAQITRLGRLNAQERIADLLLELLERLELVGMVANGRYLIPLTQEMIADALGLTSVHVNRMLQALRREGLVDWKGRGVTLADPATLARRIGRPATRVMADGIAGRARQAYPFGNSLASGG